ncbi:N-acetylmuramoyl-L-alanine amidase [Pelosinus sp. sgz500959]|uniref:N-acetylmuramoyl-L-alanine amidase family protein n=1 Tax=Pelosinus sp. sgz500959 TaxID=3242472 RepID=UPI00366C6712
MKICIDPGHGGSDSGASALGIRECDIALIVSGKVKSFLENVGYNVKLTRETDVDVFGPYASLVDELQARCDISDDFLADICVSIHCNAFNTQAKGTETFHYSGSPKGAQLAKYVQDQIIGLGGLIDRGIKDTPLYMTKHPVATAILIELAFIDNEKDYAKLSDPEWQNKFAAAIARGITDYVAK